MSEFPLSSGHTDQVVKLPQQHRWAWSLHHRVVTSLCWALRWPLGTVLSSQGKSSEDMGDQRQILVMISINCRHRIGVSYSRRCQTGEGQFLKEDNAQGTTLLPGRLGYGRVSGRGNSTCRAMERGESNVLGNALLWLKQREWVME